MRTAACVLAVLLLAGCFGGLRAPLNAAPQPGSLVFVAFGDAGTGGADQFRVAAGIGKVCGSGASADSGGSGGCTFALDLGDLLYESGADSDHDPQFDTKFETPYANLAFPFWMSLGNHDNSAPGAGAGLGTYYAQGDHEVAYAKRTDRPSDKWHEPARFYAFGADNTTASATFFALDTNTLLFNDVPFPPEPGAPVQAQAAWLDGALAAANTTWRIAFGHHPYLSNGPHGNAGAYDGRAGAPGQSGDYLKQFFEAHVCGKVDLYLAGHDHNLQWLEPNSSCKGTTLLVGGGGGASLYDLPGSDPTYFQAKSLGFWRISIEGHELTATAFDGDGQALFSKTIEKA